MALQWSLWSWRFIPTRVGRFPSDIMSSLRVSVHPHACGAVESELIASALHFGSSPRVWGGCVMNFSASDDTRFIPTRVGRFPSDIMSSLRVSVHPHACGAVFNLIREV